MYLPGFVRSHSSLFVQAQSLAQLEPGLHAAGTNADMPWHTKVFFLNALFWTTSSLIHTDTLVHQKTIRWNFSISYWWMNHAFTSSHWLGDTCVPGGPWHECFLRLVRNMQCRQRRCTHNQQPSPSLQHLCPVHLLVWRGNQMKSCQHVHPHPRFNLWHRHVRNPAMMMFLDWT